jgi:opacity protein-like surface antigen
MKNLQFKALILLLLSTLSLYQLKAQRTYANLNIGYGFKSSSQNISGFNNFSSNGGNSLRHYEQINLSLGQGAQVGGALGYMFNPNIGMELGLNYLRGANTNATRSNNNGYTDYHYWANQFRINPCLVLATGREKINPYAKFGLVVGIGSIHQTMEDYSSGDIERIAIKSNGGTALGFNSAIGAIFNLKENVNFFAEISLLSLSYAPTKAIMTKDEVNGVDRLPSMNTSQKEDEYVDSYTVDPNNQRPNSMPSISLKTKMPFSNVGINIGLQFTL